MADNDAEPWEPKSRDDWVGLFKDANLASQQHAWDEAEKLKELEAEKVRANDDTPPRGRSSFSLLGGTRRPSNDGSGS